MRFTREINRLLVGILVVFGFVAISAAYWAVVGPDTLLTREDNPRLVEREASIVRGDIFDHDGQVLVTSVQNEDGSVTRQYPHPETSSALGYFSLRYGVGGAEAAYDIILRGDDLEKDLARFVNQELLHMPQVGSDVQLTFDFDVQKQVVQAMQGHQGAAVVMSVPSGEILALVSLPTFDPNMLDENWDQLVEAEGKPFFNRVLQGNYQPGAMLDTPLLAAALLARHPLDVVFDGANVPVTVGNLTLNCTVTPPTSDLTLIQAYSYSCPAPFVRLGETLGLDTVEAIYESFGLNQPVALAGFIPEPETTPSPESTPEATADPISNGLAAVTTGQGNLTVTPLSMALVVASVINEGNAPQPYTLLAVRKPDSDQWIPNNQIRATVPFTTAQVASQLEDLMREAVNNGASSNAARPNLDIGGHSAIAYSGEGAHAWFIGFARLSADNGVVVAVVIENSDDAALAADIGGTALLAGSVALRGS
jgi:peptidoglycan glycosyltransferase